MKLKNGQSDIFFNSKDSKAIQQSNEAYSSLRANDRKMGSVDELGSQWTIMKCDPSLMNYTNTKFNILNIKAKPISLNKSQIMACLNNHEYAIAKKKKGISSFVDMTRSGVSNPNKGYKNCFHRRKSQCTLFIDLHKDYKNLVPNFLILFPKANKGHNVLMA